MKFINGQSEFKCSIIKMLSLFSKFTVLMNTLRQNIPL